MREMLAADVPLLLCFDSRFSEEVTRRVPCPSLFFSVCGSVVKGLDYSSCIMFLLAH